MVSQEDCYTPSKCSLYEQQLMLLILIVDVGMLGNQIRFLNQPTRTWKELSHGLTTYKITEKPENSHLFL